MKEEYLSMETVEKLAKCDDLQERINKAIKYLESIEEIEIRWFDYNKFLERHLISLDELKKKVKKDGTLEGHFVKANKTLLLNILKGSDIDE